MDTLIQTQLDFLDKYSVVILISGKAGVGKTTLAEYLMDYFLIEDFSSDIYPFAEGVKNCARDYFNWDGVKDERGRKLLQNIGNAGREYDENLWVNCVIDYLDGSLFLDDLVIIDDWRYPNEEERLKEVTQLYVFTVKVLSDGRGNLNGSLSSDISETSLDSKSVYDFIVVNNLSTTLEDLKKIAINISEEIFKKLN